jgi:Flp pilus assembly protein TadG
MSLFASRFFRRHAKRLGAHAAAFRRDERGTFALITGVSAVGVMLVAGLALDYSRIAIARTAVNGALDAAVLAAGSQLSSGALSGAALEQYFRDYLEGNLEQGPVDPATVTVTEFVADAAAGAVRASATTEVAMTFLALTGATKVDIHETVEAAFSSSQVEVAMVLDVTGSMKGAKLAALKTAAKDAVDILLPAGSASGKTRVGLVPYSWSVNAGGQAKAASANQSTKCVTERGGANAHTDASYTVQPVGADIRAVADNKCPNKAVRGLTTNAAKLKSDINAFSADGYTAGHIGVAWSYYMLSQNWQSLWPAAAKPADWSPDVRKIAILMTDGEFNTYYDGTTGDPFGSYQAESSGNAVALCGDMKAAKSGNPGIVIYSVAFQAPSAAKATLEACASSAGHYFDAANSQELHDAFQAIALDIQKLRLTR